MTDLISWICVGIAVIYLVVKICIKIRTMEADNESDIRPPNISSPPPEEGWISWWYNSPSYPQLVVIWQDGKTRTIRSGEAFYLGVATLYWKKTGIQKELDEIDGIGYQMANQAIQGILGGGVANGIDGFYVGLSSIGTGLGNV